MILFGKGKGQFNWPMQEWVNFTFMLSTAGIY